MYDYLTQQKHQLSQRIALWGPQNSGKTWLIHAFPKVLEIYNKADPDFHYELSDAFNENLKIFADVTNPPVNTSKLTNYYYQFQRRAKKNTISNMVSAHTHYLNIQDMSGYSTLLMDDQVKNIYRNSHMIIILLDPTLLSSFHKNDSDNSKESTIEDEFDLSLLFDEPKQVQKTTPLMAKFSPLEYADYVNKLLKYLASQPDSYPQLAICFSKSDLWKHHVTGNDLLLPTGFGLEMKSVLERYKTRFAIQQFAISSAGYSSVWHPINIEKPFFWFLEHREKQKITQRGGLIETLFQEDNLRHYKPYISLGKY